MRYLIAALIFSGSVLMVYNIIRYGIFVKKSIELDSRSAKTGTLVIPLLLLIFFLIGYIIVGLSGIADLMMALILFGGSVFVFLLMRVMFTIVKHIRETEQILALRYDEMKQEIGQLTQDAMSVFRVNLTRDEIEERSGDWLYDSDLATDSFSEMLKARGQYVLDRPYEDSRHELFTRDGLLNHYRNGSTSASEIVMVRRRDGVPTFVRFSAALTKKPVSGDVIAFIVERPYNEEVVKRVLLEKVLMNQYDRIAFIVSGNYRVLISNTGNAEKKGRLLLRDDVEDTYESIYLNVFLPLMMRDKTGTTSGPNPLRLSVIERELADKDSYEVDATFLIEGVRRHKRFVFYRIDEKAHFYLMLLSDSTLLQEEQEQRNRELEKALAEAVRSDRARIRFFTNISHDLLTPMNGILGFADLAKKESDPEKVKEYIGRIERPGRQLLAYIDDLFAMSLIDSGALKMGSEPANLPALVKEIIGRVIPACKEKGITIAAETEGLEQPDVLCDKARITKVFGRLLENSLAFSPAGENIRFSVTQETPIEEGSAVYSFRISNRGQHIPEEMIANVFDAGSWSANAEIKAIPGAGLGMTVAKAYIERMGGEILLTSNEDDKIVFTVRLPLKTAEISALPDVSAPEKDTGPLKLLIVDDNEINREIAVLILKGEGHTVETAENGAQAVEMISNAAPGTYEAVLMDVQMPVMNGYEATAAIRALTDPAKAALPIIAMTANAYQEDRNEALSAGMDGYVTKPIDPKGIATALSKVLHTGE